MHKRILLVLLVLVIGGFSIGTPHAQTISAMIQYSNPRPNAQYVSPQTTITIRTNQTLNPQQLDPTSLHVSGSKSGDIAGTLKIARDQQTLIWMPDQPFALGETITVARSALRTSADANLSIEPWSFTITTKPLQSVANNESLEIITASTKLETAKMQAPLANAPRYHTASAGIPPFTATTTLTPTAPGYVFATTFPWTTAPNHNKADGYLVLLDNDGELVFYQQPVYRVLDFRKQRNDIVSYFDWLNKQYVLLNNEYQIKDKYSAGNGYMMDLHEFLLLPNDHAIFMIYNTISMDLTAYGGAKDGFLMELVIQEMDEDHNVIFEWHSLDYLPISDTSEPVNTALVDYIHGNAIEVDTDGNLLISSRHLDEITKINRQTGDVLWRLGGKGNQFQFLNNSPQFYHQHDIRRLANGNVLLLNNWNTLPPASNSFSRAMEYKLDEIAKTATLVREFRHQNDVFAGAMGSAQRFANGNTGVGWGSTRPIYTEFDAAGNQIFDLTTIEPIVSYRAKRYEWHSTPLWDPTLVSVASSVNRTLYFSWNGATEVHDYVIKTGTTSAMMTQVAVAPRTGFETSFELPNPNACFAQVTARDINGTELRSSAPMWTAAANCVTNQIFMPITVTQ